ncbi:HSCB C-terminal oligomerization domain-domain-containing protein [Coniella lustricola]|uniref:HSCB C-terminal oligomerization domain-domain-containing protein n=1 Tax=Coniella lustricola TaxID=2025994 RepID=A0A2T3A3T0_9PEZI|nr:HSCB C-terminal oligomerization domain-domain-containing protein [Coniella lustricola]
MRANLLASRSRELSGLCATCARKQFSIRTAAPVAARAASNLQSSRAQRNNTQSLSLLNAAARRWSSTSTSSTAPADPHKTTIAHKPLPYYALFPQTLPHGPPPTGPFEVDVRSLRREFLQLQAASHPDFHHHAASDAASSSTTDTPSPGHSVSRRKAEALSSHINSAYKTLSSPLLRAQYILAERYGIDLAGDEASTLTGPPDPELLTEVLYARETIEEAASEKDLEGVQAGNDARIQDALQGMAAAFAAEDTQAAVRETVRLKYWENISESVRNWEEGKPIVLQH